MRRLPAFKVMGDGVTALEMNSGREASGLRLGAPAGSVRPECECGQKHPPTPRTERESMFSTRAIWVLGSLSGTPPSRGPPIRLNARHCLGQQSEGEQDPSGSGSSGTRRPETHEACLVARASPPPPRPGTSCRDVTGHPPALRSTGQSACGRRAHGPAGRAGSTRPG